MFITATCKDMQIDELTWVRRVSMEEKKKIGSHFEIIQTCHTASTDQRVG